MVGPLACSLGTSSREYFRWGKKLITQLTVVKVERLINLLGDSIDSIDIYISPKVYPMQSLAVSDIDFGKCEVNIQISKTGILHDIEPDIRPLKHVKEPYSPRPAVCLSGFPACVLSNRSLNHIPFL